MVITADRRNCHQFRYRFRYLFGGAGGSSSMYPSSLAVSGGAVTRGPRLLLEGVGREMGVEIATKLAEVLGGQRVLELIASGRGRDERSRGEGEKRGSRGLCEIAETIP